MKVLLGLLLLIALIFLVPSEAAHDPVGVVEDYFAAHDAKAKAACLSDDFRMWFESESGPSDSRADVLRGNPWDEELRARSRIVHMDVRGDTVIVLAHEDNDFSLLLGYSGWDPTITFVVGKDGLIERALYVPKADAPSWRSSLDSALPWLRENRPDALARVFPDSKLVRNRANAKEWVEILRAWRKATGQADPTNPE